MHDLFSVLTFLALMIALRQRTLPAGPSLMSMV